MKFYEISQNNSGGSFDYDETVCHYMIVEAVDADSARQKLSQIGVYNGAGSGDCPCCGDRWYVDFIDEVDSDSFQYASELSIYTHYEDKDERWQAIAAGLEIIEQPITRDRIIGRTNFPEYRGLVSVKTIEDYAQIKARQDDFTCAGDASVRVFFDDGKVKSFNAIHEISRMREPS